MRNIVIVAALVVVLLLVLASCGVDGPPQRPAAPAASTANPNVSISGHATIGVITEL